jgi:WD40 repeat protein
VAVDTTNKYRIFHTVKVTSPTAQLIYMAAITSPTVTTVAYSKEGSIYAVGGSSNLLIFENRTQQLLFNWTSSSSITTGVFSYDSQYYLSGCSNGLVRIFKRNCQSCPAGTFENSSSCLPCQTRLVGCTSCANSTHCYTCGNGYVLHSTLPYCLLCHSLMPGCIDCNTTSNCRACSSFYFLVNNNCSSCQLTIPNCLACSNSSACILCTSNYFVNSSNRCQPCTSLSNCL